MISEETLVLCMVLATMAGALIGFALGYGLKERKYSDEMASVMRIAKRISEANREAANRETAKKERAPKGPPGIDVKFGDGKVHRVYGRPC
jgi:hypothetical protein